MGPGLPQGPCQRPPWGRLTAVNAATGDFAWQITLGVTDGLPPGKAEYGAWWIGGPDRHRRRAGVHRHDG